MAQIPAGAALIRAQNGLCSTIRGQYELISNAKIQRALISRLTRNPFNHRNLNEFRFGLALFALINEQGPAWDSKLPMRDQKGWKEHAVFMDALADEKFIVLGGPLKKGSRHRTLLIFDALDEETIRTRMAADPWIRDGTLRIVDIYRWEILLGGLNDRSG